MPRSLQLVALLALPVALTVLQGCAAPGVEISRAPGDFAFLQVDLKG